MNSIFLLLLLLGFCNQCDSTCGCEEDRPCGASDCGDGRSGSASDCGDRRPFGTPGQNARREENPFSPFNRDQCEEQEYPPFRGNKGPCGCEDTQDA